MRIDAKSPSPKISAQNKTRKLTLTATSEIDQVELAKLSLAWTNMSDAPSVKLLQAYRAAALEEYCEKHNVTIKVDK